MKPVIHVEEIAKLTGFDRRTVTKRIEAAGLVGKKKVQRIEYDSAEAFAAVYPAAATGMQSLSEARTKESQAKTAKLNLEREILEGQRIPLELVEQEVGGLIAEFKATAKRHLKPQAQQELFAACAKIPVKLGWGKLPD